MIGNKYEYKVDELSYPYSESENTLEAVLNRYGNEGWELVNVIPNYKGTSSIGGYIQNGSSNCLSEINLNSYTIVMKRMI